MFATSPIRRCLWRTAPLLSATLLFACSDASGPDALLRPTTLNTLLAPAVIVANTDDAGPGSLRQAILDAVDGDVIKFDSHIAGGTIVLSTGQLSIDKSLTIEGPVPGGMTISGGLADRVFAVGLTGNAGIRNVSIVNGREKLGGGLLIQGKAMLENVLVANNQSEFFGAGIYLLGLSGELTLVNSTVSGNHSTYGQGGGIAAEGFVTIRNSTIAFNTAESSGGMYASNSFNNKSIRNTIIANNIGTRYPQYANCEIPPNSSVVFQGRNMSNDDTCGTDPTMTIAEPLLGPLGNNGGPTRTHALLIGSPAIDAGLLCTESTDQRYVARNQGTSCDIGAFEFDTFRTVSLTIEPNVAVNAKTGVATVSGTISCVGSAPTPLGISLSQTQRTTGKFTTIIQAQTNIPATCTTNPTSWSAQLTPTTGKFEHGTATGSATVLSAPGGYVATTVTAALKLFNVK